jgi:hypothetical protein
MPASGTGECMGTLTGFQISQPVGHFQIINLTIRAVVTEQIGQPTVVFQNMPASGATMIFEGGKPVTYGTSIMSTQKNPSFDFIFIVSNQRRDHATI